MNPLQNLIPKQQTPCSSVKFNVLDHQISPTKSHSKQETDLSSSMKCILQRIQNIKQEVQKDKFDSFIDKTMIKSEKENDSFFQKFTQDSHLNQLIFSKKKLKTRVKTNVCLPLQEQEKEYKQNAKKLDRLNILTFSCKNIHSYNSRYLEKDNKPVNSFPVTGWKSFNFRKPPALTQPLKIGDFELGSCIGSGKFGDVHICRHKRTKWLFALKKVLKSTIEQFKMMNQFINELKIQYKLDHPNIVKLYAHFSDQYHIFLLMEYAPGGTLMQHISNNEQYTSNVLEQMLEAINHTHINNVIHRDIKPENIVVYFDKTFKLCDFGLSAYLSPQKDVRTSFCGTLDYIAPEMKDIGLYNYSVDIWGLGVLAYEVLIGSAPFKEQITNWKKRGGRRYSNWNWKISIPVTISSQATKFMQNLLKENPNERVSLSAALMSDFIKNRKKEISYLTKSELNQISQ